MGRPKHKTLGLKTGLAILALVSLAFLAFILSAEPPAEPPQPATSKPDYDAATSAYIETLEVYSPDIAEKLRTTLSLTSADEDLDAVRRATLQANLAVYRAQAGWLRYASNADYDRMVSHFTNGLNMLEETAPQYCSGAVLEPLLRLESQAVMPAFLDLIQSSDVAYRWALEWNALFLDVTAQARLQPTRRGPLLGYDKAVLQETGLTLGPEQWALALQIVAFSQAEGRNYGTMRQAVRNIDICRLGQAMAEMSARLPRGPKGRIWADLMPEVFAGNTPYVLYRVNDYFFLD